MASALLSLSRLAAPTGALDGSKIAEARHALDYWSTRESNVPWHRRAERREARTMIATSRARLIAAHLDHWGFGRVARVLAPVLDTGGKGAGAHLRSLAWTPLRRTAIGRRILFAAAGVAAAVVACLAVVAGVVLYLVF
jgi:hypothetical protein